MSERNTLARSAHDLGLGAWFGGSLMGVVGLNGAAAQAASSRETLRLSSLGWGRWSPVAAGAIALHAIGGVGLIAGNQGRLKRQAEARTNTAAKTAVTVVAAGVTAYSGALGTTIHEHQDNPAEGTTEPDSHADQELKSAQKQLKYCHWAVPVLTGALIVMGAQQGEQQQPKQRAFGRR